LTSAATTAATRVSFSAATDSGDEIACQKPDQPSCFDSHASAASGRTTISSRNVDAKPSERAVPALSLGRWIAMCCRSRGAST